MKVLLVGLGSAGNKHLNSLIKHKELEVSVYDKNKGTHKNQQSLEDVRDKEYDKVIIATPVKDRASLIEQLEINNCDILFEKPFAENLNSLKNLFTLLSKKNINLYPGLTYRFDPAINYIKMLIENNKLGKLYDFHVKFGSSAVLKNSVSKYQYKSKRSLFDDNIHFPDLFCYLTNDFGEKEVLSFSSLDKVSKSHNLDVSHSKIIFKSSENILGSFIYNFLEEQQDSFIEIIGNKGKIKYYTLSSKVQLVTSKTLSKNFPKNRQHIFDNQMNEFLKGNISNFASKDQLVSLQKFNDKFI